jgi:Domain of unknown function (DUF397)
MNRTDLSGVLWRKSSYSNGQANCVEIALRGGRTTVVVRDSKAPGGSALMFSAQAGQQFAYDLRGDAKDCLDNNAPLPRLDDHEA